MNERENRARVRSDDFFAVPQRFDNDIELSNEPGFCTDCGLQFDDGNVIDFDNQLPFTYVVGRTVKNKYVVHRGVKIVHVKPSCKEVKQEWDEALSYKEAMDRNRV